MIHWTEIKPNWIGGTLPEPGGVATPGKSDDLMNLVVVLLAKVLKLSSRKRMTYPEIIILLGPLRRKDKIKRLSNASSFPGFFVSSSACFCQVCLPLQYLEFT